MGLHHRPEVDGAPARLQARLEAAQLLGVVLRAEPSGEEREAPAGGKIAREQLAGDGADGERIGRHGRQPLGVGRIGHDADDRDVAARRLADARSERRRIPRGDDEAVGAVAKRLLEQRHVSLAQVRIGAEVDVQRRRERCRALANPLAAMPGPEAAR